MVKRLRTNFLRPRVLVGADAAKPQNIREINYYELTTLSTSLWSLVESNYLPTILVKTLNEKLRIKPQDSACLSKINCALEAVGLMHLQTGIYLLYL